jgi:tRNA threonylcarbamoyladenosine biosynthesis protein TsaE
MPKLSAGFVGQPLLLYLPDVEATIRLGALLGRELGAGEFAGPLPALMLHGEMGSGKTTLIRGMVEALPGGDQAEVCSPSFTILNFYPTLPPTIHADLFRCPPGAALPDELEDALASADEPGGAPGTGEQRDGFLVVVEWAEHLPLAMLPPQRLDILLQPCHASRRLVLAAHGPGACRANEALRNRVERECPQWLDMPGTP